MIHRLKDLIGAPHTKVALSDGRFGRAVPEPFYGGPLDRLKDAIAVFCGGAYAVRWPVPGEHEDAILPGWRGSPRPGQEKK